MYSFFLPKQASIARSVHSDFQHSAGSRGVSPIVREETLDPSRFGLVRAAFGKSAPTLTKPFTASGPSKRPILIKLFTPSGPSNRPTLKEPLTQNPSRKVCSRTLKEPCEDQKILSVPPWNLTPTRRNVTYCSTPE